MEKSNYKVIFEFKDNEVFFKFLTHMYTGIDRIQEAMEIEGGTSQFKRMSDLPEVYRFLISFEESK